MRALSPALALCLLLCLAACPADARRHLHGRRAGSTHNGRRLAGSEQDSVLTAAPFRPLRVSGINPAAITPSDGAVAGAAHLERRLQQQDPTRLPYKGGPVLAGTVNVYMTFMGYNQTEAVPDWLQNLVNSLSGHRWWNVMTRYFSNTTGMAQYMSPNVQLAGTVFVNPDNTLAMTDDNQYQVVYETLTQVAADAGFPKSDPNGIYVLVASPNSGLKPPPSYGANTPTGFCGWHSASPANGFAFAYIPDPTNTPSCLWPDVISPSGNPAADVMASVLLHELAEAATDPLTNAWIDDKQQEAGDKCNYLHGDLAIAQYGPNNQDVHYNQVFGGRPYVVQQIWNPDFDPNTNQQVGCVQGLDPTTATN